MFIREFNKCLNILSVSFYCHSLWSIKTLSSTLTTAFWWELKYKVWDWESRELASCFIYKGRWYQGLFIWFLPIGNAYLSVSFPCSHVQIVCMHAYGHITYICWTLCTWGAIQISPSMKFVQSCHRLYGCFNGQWFIITCIFITVKQTFLYTYIYLCLELKRKHDLVNGVLCSVQISLDIKILSLDLLPCFPFRCRG